MKLLSWRICFSVSVNFPHDPARSLITEALWVPLHKSIPRPSGVMNYDEQSITFRFAHDVELHWSVSWCKSSFPGFRSYDPARQFHALLAREEIPNFRL